MVNITAYLLSGTGTVPKQVSKDAVVLLILNSDITGTYDWEFVGKPPAANVVIQAPTSKATKIGPFNSYGVYQVRGWVNRGAWNQQSRTVSIGVPQSIGPLPTPPEPLFATGGEIRNFSFELPGVHPGEADEWDTRDDADILSTWGGITRGRIIPTNFVVPSGLYAMCLGDDLHKTHSFLIGQIFAVSQEVDFTNANILKVHVKFEKP